MLASESMLLCEHGEELKSFVPFVFSVVFPTKLPAKRMVAVKGPNGVEVELKKEIAMSGRNATSMRLNKNVSFCFLFRDFFLEQTDVFFYSGSSGEL